MANYIGIDTHTQSCTLQGMTPRAKLSKHFVVRTNARELIAAVEQFPRPRIVCFEEGTMSEWLCEILRPHVDRIYVVQPQKRRGYKSDAEDARALADLARTGPKQTVFKADGQLAELRAAARNYEECQSDVVRAKNRLLAAYRARGVRLPKDYGDEESRDEILALLKPPYSIHAQALATRVDAALTAREQAAEWLQTAAARVSAVKLLSSIPGIGTIRAAQIVAVVISPSRFPSRSKFKSYAGLGLRTADSAEWEENAEGTLERRKRSRKARGLNQNRNPILKRVFFGAALTVSKMKDHPLAEDYRRHVAGGMDEQIARATLARRIAVVTLAVWRNKEAYDPAKHVARPQAA